MRAMPPRFAEWLTARSLPPDDRDAVLGDLAEEHADLSRHRGARAADAWYWRQTLTSLGPNLRRRLAGPAGPRIERGDALKGTEMDGVLQDLRYGWRMMRGRPGLTAVAVGSLVVGVALPAVVAFLLDAVLLRPLPIEAPDRVAVLLQVRDDGVNHNFSHPDFTDYRATQRSFTDMAAYSRTDVTMRGSSGSQVIAGELVSGGYFTMLGVRLRFGRGLTEADDRPGAAPVAVVSEALWRSLSGDGEAPFGPRTITLNAREFAIVGVAAAPFRGMEVGRDTRVWAPLHVQPLLDPSGSQDLLDRRTASWLTLVGRLRPGLSREQATRDLNVTLNDIARSAGRPPAVLTLAPGRQGDSSLPELTGAPLRLLLGAALLVLVVACANVANLLLARATERAREIAVRAALGAGRWRLARLVLVETLLLGVIGSVIAVLVARWLADLAVPFIASYGQPVTLDLDQGWRVVALAALSGLAVTVIVAVAPMWAAMRQPVRAPLAAGGRGASAGPAGTRTRRGLVAVQFALSLALVAAASLLARTVYNLRVLPTGFDIDHVALLSVDPEAAQFSAERTRDYVRRAIDRLASTPGVTAAAFGRVIPLGFGGSRTSFAVPGYQPAAGEDMEVNFNVVSGTYFAATGIQLIDGRAFDARDTADRPAVAIVNQTMAAKYWPGGRAVGQRVRFGRDDPGAEIVGVARDVKYRTLREEAGPSLYLAIDQERPRAGVLHVRTQGDPAALLDPLRRALLEVDAAVPVTAVRTLQDQARLNTSDERMAMLIGLALGGAAVLLAAVGLYGSMSYAVGQRRRELAVRIALGAARTDIRRLVIGQAIAMSIAGAVLGVALAIILGRSLEHRLFGVRALDLPTLLMSAAALGGVALLATWMPARRASRVDPVEALRGE